jgi:hypothetical protein
MAGFNSGAMAMRELAASNAAAPTPPPSPEHQVHRSALDIAEERNALLATVCRMGLASAVRSALSLGADPSRVSRDGRTPVFEAAYHGHLEVLVLLCESGADIDVGWTAAQTGMSYTAREIALLCGRAEVVQVLDAVAAGARALAAAQQRLAWVKVVHGRLGISRDRTIAPSAAGSATRGRRQRPLLTRDLLRLVASRVTTPAAVCVRVAHSVDQPLRRHSFFRGPPPRPAAASSLSPPTCSEAGDDGSVVVGCEQQLHPASSHQGDRDEGSGGGMSVMMRGAGGSRPRSMAVTSSSDSSSGDEEEENRERRRRRKRKRKHSESDTEEADHKKHKRRKHKKKRTHKHKKRHKKEKHKKTHSREDLR